MKPAFSFLFCIFRMKNAAGGIRTPVPSEGTNGFRDRAIRPLWHCGIQFIIIIFEAENKSLLVIILGKWYDSYSLHTNGLYENSSHEKTGVYE